MGRAARAHPLLEKLANARLLIVRQADDARMVEVAHEALLRKWPQLRGWLDDAREFLIGKQQLAADLRDWQHAGESDKAAALLTGLKLSRAREWLAERPHQLSAEERALIQASVDREEADRRRKARQRRAITISSIAAAVVLAVFAAFAGYQWLETQKAFRTRATELARYAWVDLAEQQMERQRLTDIAHEMGADRRRLVPQILVCANEICTEYEPQIDGYDCGTSLESGFRYLYCSIRSVINFEKAQSIAGMPIFRQGSPHAVELNLRHPLQFGHYDPDFLTWLDDYLIPEGRSDPRFNQLTRIAYDAYIGSIVRALYHTHEILFASPEEYRPFERNYETVRQKVVATRGRARGIGFMAEDLTAFPLIKAEYSELLEQENGIPGLYFETKFFAVSDYLTNVMHDDWYMANTAGGFWVRRSIDGTEAQFFELVKKVLQTFEPEVLGFRPSDPPLF